MSIFIKRNFSIFNKKKSWSISVVILIDFKDHIRIRAAISSKNSYQVKILFLKNSILLQKNSILFFVFTFINKRHYFCVHCKFSDILIHCKCFTKIYPDFFGSHAVQLWQIFINQKHVDWLTFNKNDCFRWKVIFFELLSFYPIKSM